MAEQRFVARNRLLQYKIESKLARWREI